MINYTEARRGKLAGRVPKLAKDSFIEADSIFFKLSQEEALRLLDLITNQRFGVIDDIDHNLYKRLRKQYLKLLGYEK